MPALVHPRQPTPNPDPCSAVYVVLVRTIVAKIQDCAFESQYCSPERDELSESELGQIAGGKGPRKPTGCTGRIFSYTRLWRT
jgi:hypothetical protein